MPLIAVGIDVNADALEPEAENNDVPARSWKINRCPALPTIPLSPGRLRRTTAFLLHGWNTTGDGVPITVPVSSVTVIVTVVAAPLGLTMATPVM